MTDTGRLMPRRREMHPRPYYPDYKTSVTRAPALPLLSLESGPSEETGPRFGHGLIGPLDNNLILNFSQGASPAIGERIRVHGRVMDEAGRPVPETLVEVWQANAGGRYRHVKDTYFAPLDAHFGGCGRTLTDADGGYEFMTIRPGAYPWPNRANDWRPMHIHFSVFGHAFGQRLITQMYFEGDPLIDRCPIAATIADQGQRDRLVAPLDMQNARPMDYLAYRFDIVLRGRRQSMFENRPAGMCAMVQPLDLLTETPSQTAGPYVHIGCIPSYAGLSGVYPQDLGLSPVTEGAQGMPVTITGQVIDGTGWALRDAMLESWQADAAGLYPGQPGADPHVMGFCRFATDGESGTFTLNTIRPGPVALGDARVMAPHVSLWIVARGINIGLHTRLYFADADNSADPLLARIEQRHRVDTLIAEQTAPGAYRFDIRLQGDRETVFLDI